MRSSNARLSVACDAVPPLSVYVLAAASMRDPHARVHIGWPLNVDGTNLRTGQLADSSFLNQGGRSFEASSDFRLGIVSGIAFTVACL
jgi:hypothetical protein